MRVFIFGIGGTGSRVLRSLAMLLASGVKFNNSSLEIVPVIVDMDAHNGDTARTRELFRSYHTIRRAFTDPASNSQTDTFFNTKIKSFSRPDTELGDAADLDLQFDFQNHNDTFAQYINYYGLSSLNKDVLELLYNDSTNKDDFPELHLDLRVGFKGNPNIGSVVFNSLAESQQFRNLESSYTPTDRIFIISSIFGGTGSSGFPTLVKLIRNSTNPNLRNTLLGAITVMPYFNVEDKKDSAIKSEFFITKTKAALSYYEKDEAINSINALYYLADANQASTLPNHEGGAEQTNDAHLMELIAATSIADFIEKSDTDLQQKRFYEFGAEKDGHPFTIAHFSNKTKEKYIKPLARFAYAAQIATQFVPQLKDNTFYNIKELNIGASLGAPGEYGKLIDFFKLFKTWSGTEMTRSNGRAFNTFGYDDAKTVNNLVLGATIPTSWLSSGMNIKKIGENLDRFIVKEVKDLPKPKKYLNILYKTADACLAALGQLPV